jgi:hypothetical protein
MSTDETRPHLLGHRCQHIEHVFRVEADFDRVTCEVDIQLFGALTEVRVCPATDSVGRPCRTR